MRTSFSYKIYHTVNAVVLAFCNPNLVEIQPGYLLCQGGRSLLSMTKLTTFSIKELAVPLVWRGTYYIGLLYLYAGAQLTPRKILDLLILLYTSYTIFAAFELWSSDRTRVLISWPCDYHFQRLRQMSSFLVVGTIVGERKVGQPASQWW